MKTNILIIVASVMLLPVSKVQAVDVDFYTDGVIESGDNYEVVNVWNDALVDMSGGYLARLRTHDFSTMNIYDGNVHQGISSLHSSTVNIYGGILTLDYLDILYSSVLNVYGGDLIIGNSPGFSESSTVNIYGYGFNYGLNRLTGFLSDGSPFIFNELPFDKYSHMNLIPEPASVVLLSSGIIFLRKRK